MNISVYIVLIRLLVKPVTSASLSHKPEKQSLHDELEKFERINHLEEFSTDCWHQNVKISPQINQQILILYEKIKHLHTDSEDSFFASLRRRQFGPYIILDASKLNEFIGIPSSHPLHVIWLVNKYTSLQFYDIFKIATKIHIVYLRKLALTDSELDKVSNVYFQMFREPTVYRVQFHGLKFAAEDRFMWRALEVSRDHRQRASKTAKCQYSGEQARIVNIWNPPTCKTCLLKVLARPLEPFTYLNEDKKFINGIEISLIELIAAQLGMTTDFALGTNSTGDAYEILMDNVHFSDIDVVIGGFAKVSLAPSPLVSTRPYLQDDSTWCVAHARLLRPWVNLFVIFGDLQIVALHSVAFVAGSTVMFFFAQKRYIGRHMSYPQTCVTFVQLTLNGSTKFGARSTLVRIFSGILLLMVMFYYQTMTSCYIGIIAFRIEGTQTKTQRALVDLHYKLAGDVNSYLWIMAKDQVSFLKQSQQI